MPNQRSKKKKFVGGYVNYKTKLHVEEIAIEHDTTKSAVVEMFLREGVERYHITGKLKPVSRPKKH